MNPLIQRVQALSNDKHNEARYFFCPGRVNLIGEHIDYNGGLVMPAALTIGIMAMVSPNEASEVIVMAEGREEVLRFNPDTLPERFAGHDWRNYPLGMAYELKNKGLSFPACSIYIAADLPEGSGLSSSAALEVLIGFIGYTLQNITPDLMTLALLAQSAENTFVGVPCGIMDQAAVALGQEGNAIRLDCATLAYTYVPIAFGDYALVLMNSRAPRALAESKYHERLAECREALRLIQEKDSSILHLIHSTQDHWENLPELLMRRTRHVATEQARVLRASTAMANGDMLALGDVLNESHFSLAKDYEVSGEALDRLTEAARTQPGCIGARMTGAGFGGCAIALVKKEALADFTSNVFATYKRETQLEVEMLFSGAGKGVHEVLV
jgi:galactokinase